MAEIDLRDLELPVGKRKDKYQLAAFQAWANSSSKNGIIAATGFGKSRVLLRCAQEVLSVEENTCILLVPRVNLIEQFKQEAVKAGFNIDRLEIECFQTAYKMKGRHFTQVLVDEVHLGASPEYRKFFENNTWNYIMWATATAPENPEYLMYVYSKLGTPAYTITLDECRTLELVSDYKVYAVPLAFEPEAQKEYNRYDYLFKKMQTALGGQWEAFDEARERLNSKINYTPGEIKEASLYMAGMRGRKTVINKSKAKVNAAVDLIKTSQDHKIITFGSSNTSTDDVWRACKPDAGHYHSGVAKAKREKELEAFKNGEYKALCSTEALNQGTDVPAANVAIILGLTSKSLTMIQRIGRVIRYEENKQAAIIILYMENTQEEKWLKKATKSVLVEYLSLQEIKETLFQPNQQVLVS